MSEVENTTTPKSESEALWDSVVDPLRGYVKVRTNNGKKKIHLVAPTQAQVKEEAAKLEKPEPPKKVAQAEGGKKTKREIVDEKDPEFLKAVEDFGMMQTYLLVDLGLRDKPRGETFLERCATYRRISAPILGAMVAGIQSLMMQEPTPDMYEDGIDGNED